MSIRRGETGESGGVDDLVTALRALHLQAGKPSMRTIASAVGNVSHTTVAEALNGKRVPSWPIMQGIIRYLHGDEESLQRLWISATDDSSTSDAEARVERDFFARYRQQVATHYGTLSPPHLEFRLRVPIRELFVAPMIRDRHGITSRIDLSEFSSEAGRTVLLGGAGSGKSTLCHALIHLTANADDGVIPFMVSLRDFSADTHSLASFIERQIGFFLQESAPEGAVHKVLRGGNAFIIFDDLDEVGDLGRRREVAAAIEMFCEELPTVRVLVVSRSFEYGQSQLDPKQFTVYEIADFDDLQVRQYVDKWFVASAGGPGDRPKLSAHGAQVNAAGVVVEGQALAFLRESEDLSDIRANPLFLAHICQLFRGPGWIKHNLLEVYERCFLLLSDRWDLLRGLGEDPIDRRVRVTVLQRVAFWMLSETPSRPVATADEIIRTIRNYLHEREYDVDQVEGESNSLFENFSGRAQLLSEVDVTSSGEPIYEFRYRSFLEYLAGSYLARTSRSAEELAVALAPRLAQQEWMTVALVAISTVDRTTVDGGKRALSALLDEAQEMHDDERSNLHRFLHQSMDLVQLPYHFARQLASLSDEVIKSAESKSHSGSIDNIGYRGPAACQIVGITYKQLDYWARTGLVAPSILSKSPSGARLYSFKDILVLKVVKRLLDTGVSLQNIRVAVDHLRRRGVRDLATVTLFSDGTAVYEASSPEEIVDLLQGGQGVFGIAVSGALREINETIHEFPAERGDGVPVLGSEVRQALNASTA